MKEKTESRVLVGVVPEAPDAVIREAALFAARFDAELVCAWVDSSRYVVEELSDGSARSMSTDPDLVDVDDASFPAELAEEITRIVRPFSIRWSTRRLAGDPARALGRLAELLDAAAIVVGTRRATMRGTLREMFSGSVAVYLAHRQRRPVVVIPLNPVSFDEPLPWEDR